MGIVKLSTAGILDYQKYSSMLAGNDPYIPPVLAYDLLETEILTGSQASVTFSSLNSTYGADYQHLEIRMTTRSTKDQTNQDTIYAYLNADTGSNYAWHRLYGDGSSVTSSSGSSASQARIGFTPANGASSTANGFAATILTILDPFNTSKNTTLRSLNGSATNDEAILLYSSLWNNTAALTSIEIEPASDSWITGCRFSLYGLKKGA